MAVCEKCWADSAGNDLDPLARYARYDKLVNERDCTPEERAGDYAGTCPACLRKTVNKNLHLCLVPDCSNVTGEVVEDE